MEFCLAGMKDLAEVEQMYRRIVADMEKKGLFIWNQYYPAEVLGEDIAQRRLYVCREGGAIWGAFALTEWEEGEGDIRWTIPGKALYLDRLGVEPARSGKGVGTQAVRQAMAQAEKRGAEVLRLFLAEGNEPAFRLYQKLGFRRAPGIYEEAIGAQRILRQSGWEISLYIKEGQEIFLSHFWKKLIWRRFSPFPRLHLPPPRQGRRRCRPQRHA